MVISTASCHLSYRLETLILGKWLKVSAVEILDPSLATIARIMDGALSIMWEYPATGCLWNTQVSTMRVPFPSKVIFVSSTQPWWISESSWLSIPLSIFSVACSSPWGTRLLGVNSRTMLVTKKRPGFSTIKPSKWNSCLSYHSQTSCGSHLCTLIRCTTRCWQK